MLKRILKILKSTFLVILLAGISVMPWLGYIEVPVMNEDYLILSWFNPHTVLDSFSSFVSHIVSGAYWRPVVWTATAVTKYFFEYQSWPYHITNILVYGVVVFAFFNFMQRIGFERRRAWLGAFIFSVLPAHELSVAWIAGRTDTVMAMFLLFGVNNLVYAYKNNRYYFIPAVLFFFFAMLSKEPAYAVPALPFLFLLLREKKLKKKDIYLTVKHSLILAAIVLFVLGYRYFVIGGTPFESQNFAHFDVLTIVKNFFLYIPVSFLRADQVERIYYFLLEHRTVEYIAAVVFILVIVLMVLRYRKMEQREKHLLLFGFLWYVVFIVSALTFFGQWYAFTASMGLIIMLMSFLKLDINRWLCKYVFYFILITGIIVSIVNSTRSDKWLESAERADIAYASLDYSPAEKDTLVFLGVPDKLNNVNCMKIGFSQAIWYHLGNDSIEVSSALRMEMSDESFISIERIAENEIVMELLGGRFKPVGERSRARIVDETLNYEDGFQKIYIETKTKPIILSKAHIIIKKKSLINKVFLFNGEKFIHISKLNKQLKNVKFSTN